MEAQCQDFIQFQKHNILQSAIPAIGLRSLRNNHEFSHDHAPRQNHQRV